jgi:hypothetical protein
VAADVRDLWFAFQTQAPGIGRGLKTFAVQQDAAGIGDQQRAHSALARCIRVVAGLVGNKGLGELPGEPPERHMTRLGANPFGRGLFGGNHAADIHEEGRPEFGISTTETVRMLLGPICFGMPLSRV